jgi:hypothetical protein
MCKSTESSKAYDCRISVNVFKFNKKLFIVIDEMQLTN